MEKQTAYTVAWTDSSVKASRKISLYKILLSTVFFGHGGLDECATSVGSGKGKWVERYSGGTFFSRVRFAHVIQPATLGSLMSPFVGDKDILLQFVLIFVIRVANTLLKM